jgi:hypothetical protein
MMTSSFLPRIFWTLYIFIQNKKKKNKTAIRTGIQHLAFPDLIQQCHPSFSLTNTRTIPL